MFTYVQNAFMIDWIARGIANLTLCLRTNLRFLSVGLLALYLRTNLRILLVVLYAMRSFQSEKDLDNIPKNVSVERLISILKKCIHI